MTTPSDLRAQANELIQSDSPLQRSLAQRLFIQAAELEGRTVAPACNAHVDAYRDHMRAERVHAQMAAANAKVRAALSDIYGDRLTSSLHPRNRITAH